MEDFYEDEIDNEVNDIISQIKNQSKVVNTPEVPKDPLEKDKMEDFIIQNAASVVQDAVRMVDQLKSTISAAAEPDLINSMSSLLRATTSAIDSLTKLKIAEDKNKNQKEIAQMVIENKGKNDEDRKGFLVSREEVVKALMERKKEEEEPIKNIPLTVNI
jgi:hypothetical protein